MKKLLLFGLATILFTACNQKQRYTQKSPEIDSFKSVIKSYNNEDWEGMKVHYADTAKTFNNSSDVGLSINDMIAYHKESLGNLSSRGFLEKDQEYEMVVTDKGDTWVNFWGDWEGTLKANGKKIKIPIHLTGQFKDGKIVGTSGNWDNAPMALALQEIEAKNNMPPEQKIMDQNLDILIDKFHNEKDITVLDNILATNYVRYMNGVKVASNAKELGEGMSNTFMKGFPNMKISNSERIYKGNKAYIHWVFTGTNTGEFNDLPPTGKKIKVSGLSEAHFNGDGKLYLEKVYFNEVDLLNQLGYTVSPPKS